MPGEKPHNQLSRTQKVTDLLCARRSSITARVCSHPPTIHIHIMYSLCLEVYTRSSVNLQISSFKNSCMLLGICTFFKLCFMAKRFLVHAMVYNSYHIPRYDPAQILLNLIVRVWRGVIIHDKVRELKLMETFLRYVDCDPDLANHMRVASCQFWVKRDSFSLWRSQWQSPLGPCCYTSLILCLAWLKINPVHVVTMPSEVLWLLLFAGPYNIRKPTIKQLLS